MQLQGSLLRANIRGHRLDIDGVTGARRRIQRVIVARRSSAAATKAPSRNGNVMTAPYNVVITGGSKGHVLLIITPGCPGIFSMWIRGAGVGRALAEEFIRSGDNVVICSRSDDRVKTAVRELDSLVRSLKGEQRVKGVSCNVAKPGDIASFANYVQDEMGYVDLWINNAGSNAYKYNLLSESSDADLINIVETNVLGVMLSCKEAIRVMRNQTAGGHIFNMDGAGADGSPTPRFAAYGATKRGLVQLGKSLQAELKMLGINNVGIHNLSPGMVTTELLMAGADTPTAKFFINCLAEPPEVVADYLVPRIRRVPQESRTLTGGIGQGTYIQYLTKGKAYSQILQRLLLGKRKNRYVRETDGAEK